jgi:hypothetical protein
MRPAAAFLTAFLCTTPALPAAEPVADPAATKLLAEARAARATWTGFPGFTADAAVRADGRLLKGQVRVTADGEVTFTGLPPEEEAWARRTLGSVVGHRLASAAPLDTPCRFLDPGDAEHPLGRAVQVLNDEFHSSYRIRDRQIIVVNRSMQNEKFTITVQENRKTPAGKYLSASFVVNYWDKASGELLRSEANLQGWARVDSFELPAELTVVTAKKANGGEGQSARTLTLTRHQLMKTTAAK